VKLKELTQNKLERHELHIRLTDAAKEDKQAVNSRLVVSTKYYPCESIAAPAQEGPSELLGAETKDGAISKEAAAAAATLVGGCGDDVVDDDETFESMGILGIKSIELAGVQTNAGMNLVGERIYLKMDCLGVELKTIKKVNKAAPSSVTWLESFYFVVTNTSQVAVRFHILHKPSTLASVGKVMTGAMAGAMSTLTGGRSAAASHDRVIGTVEFLISDLVKSKGTLEVDDMYFGSDYAHGELSCSLEYKQNRR